MVDQMCSYLLYLPLFKENMSNCHARMTEMIKDQKGV